MINGARKTDFFRDQNRNNLNRNVTPNQTNQVEKSNIGESRRLKIQIIQANNPNNAQSSAVNIQINPKTWPSLKVNDLIEVSSRLSQNTNSSITPNQLTSLNRGAPSSLVLVPSSIINQNQPSTNDDETSPYLVQILPASFNDSIPLDTIRIDQSASQAPFSLKNIPYVNATIVDRSGVMLDLVEVIFKEQYINGYDMLRIKKSIENSVVYLKKNIEFCLIRCAVKDLWSVNGDNVTCGYIGEKTRLVFRSQSAMCLIYIQMSREMWEFDVNGEMYHEKAINFLGELFKNWKNQLCTHDVTIALFSRVFYDAKSMDEFPCSIGPDIKKDHKNRFYEDFFQVVYQNERYEDWTPTLIILKRVIKDYRDYVLNYHSRQMKQAMPPGSLSSAAEGNFLETLNLSSSVFERHFIDRPFDRTGMMSLVVTPGNGIYEVNRDLSKITKERVIDNGIGSDLVCLGEQPLHAVPLFKYDVAIDAFDIPIWINLSFYESSEMVRYCNSCFLPRSKIKLKTKNNKLNSDGVLPDYSSDKYLTSLEESDNIFENNKIHLEAHLSKKRTNYPSYNAGRSKPKRFYTNSLSHLSSSMMSQHEFPNGVDNDDADNDSSIEFDSDCDGASGDDTRKIKRKINPFTPNQVKRSQRRPWAHIFPLRSDGSPIFPHEEKSSLEVKSNLLTSITIPNMNVVDPSLMPKISPDSGYFSNPNLRVTNSINKSHTISESNSLLMPIENGSKTKKQIPNSKSTKWETMNKDESIGLLKTGVAWKSLTTPACFPLTIDYTPSEKILRDHFQCASDYTLLLETIREEYGYSNYEYNNKITMSQVFIELVGHRLAMGFQIVVPKNIYTHHSNSSSNSESISTTPTNSSQSNINDIQSHTLTNTLHSNFICDLSQSCSILPRNNLKSIKGYYKLSLGRIFHELFYIVDPSDNSEQVKVEIYVPKTKNKNQPNKTIEYKYRFQVPDSKTYDISYCEMTRTNIESVKWNYIDRYISIQGNGSLTPSELEKCWRQRLYLLPIMYVSSKSVNFDQPRVQNIANNLMSLGFTNLTLSQIPASLIQNPYSTLKCDIFQRKSDEELQFIRDFYFIKFMEGLNKLNRADDRRLYSRSTIHYLDLSSNTTPSHSQNVQDLVLAVSAITSALTQINSSSSSQTNLNKNQFMSFPNICKKNSSNQQIKLPSPKINLFPLVEKYLKTLDQSLRTEISNYLNTEYKIHMLNPSYGIPCIQNKNDIPLHCFVSAEAVWWCIEYISDCVTESDGILIMQLMSDFEIIRHISNQQKLFAHGFYLFYFITEETLNHQLYTKDYCEVGFVDIESPREPYEKFPLVSCKHLLPEYSSTLPISAKNLFDSYINLFKNYSNTKFTNTNPDGILKLVNVDVDPSRKSNRVEWASAVYRSHYHQLCAFELEVQWEVATCSLLSETVTMWSKLSNRFNYHIVPAPIDPFAMPLVQNSDPLRGPIYIGLNLRCILANEGVLFQDMIDEKYSECLEELFSDKYNSSFKLESSSSSSSESYISSTSSSLSTNTATNMYSITRAERIFEFLNERAPEFLVFLNHKHESKRNLERRLHEDVEFIRQEFCDFVEYQRIIRLIYFQEAVLEKFGFIRNAAVVKNLFTDEDSTFFIHASGGMFVYIPNYYLNYSNRSRHPSANNFTDPSKSSSIILNKATEYLKSELENRRERLITRKSELSEDLTDGKRVIRESNSGTSSAKTSFNTSLNNSYVSNSHMNNIQNIHARERSNTKSQHLKFLKINGNNYLPDSSGSLDKENKPDSIEDLNDNGLKREASLDEIKNDLLFKPKSSNAKISAKNEKIDQIQHQHQKEQMLLVSFANASNSSYQKYMAQKESRKTPFYADTEQFIGFFWSWNFMLGKRWRSQYTGDEQFQDNMLSDFRLFCSNQDGRLEKFFKESRDLLR